MFVLALLVAQTSWAAAPATNLTVTDKPNDAGTGLIVTWTLSADDRDAQLQHYEIQRAAGDSDTFAARETVPAGTTKFVDSQCDAGVAYRYRLIAVAADGTAAEPVTSPIAVVPTVQWFDTSRLWFAAFVAFVCGAVIVCTELARAGRPVYVRPIAGLQAIDEAVGRATEMGRPMLFVPGIMDLDQIETVAGLTVLAQIAKKAAEYDTPLEVPTARVLVMSAAREMCEAAALTAGRPDSYDADRITYVTDDQFGYVAHVCGWIVRQKPAACFFLGKFYAESLILAETGRSVGAIQIGGTAEAAQLPFFVAACDYALIGEELFAASAYLSGEPQQLGTVQGQDWGKFLAIALILVGCLLATAAATSADSAVATAYQLLKDRVLVTGGEG